MAEDNADINRRLNNLEAYDKEMRHIVDELVVNTRVMNENLIMLSSMEARMRAIENKTLSNEIILKGIRWIGTIVVGTGITVVIAAVLSTVLKGV